MEDRPEMLEVEDAVEADRSSGGHEKSAGVGEVEGEGDDARTVGGDPSVSPVLSMPDAVAILSALGGECGARCLQREDPILWNGGPGCQVD